MAKYGSVEEMNTALDKEFADVLIPKIEEVEEIKKPEELEEVEEVEEVEEEIFVEGEEIEGEEEEESKEEVEEKPVTGDEKLVVEKTKPDKKDKADHAFKELRTEADELRKKTTAQEQKLKDLETVAIQLGYKNADELLNYQKTKLIEEEAKAKGIDPAIYKKIQALEEREEKREQEIKITTFKNTFDAFGRDNGLTDAEKQTILAKLDADRWSLDVLITIPNPKIVLQGYATDIIAERKTQKILKEKKSTVEKPFTQTKEVPIETFDTIIQKDMEKRRKERGY